MAELALGRVAWQKDGAREALLEGMAVPTGLAADGEHLYAADWAMGTVTRVDSTGEGFEAQTSSSPMKGAIFRCAREERAFSWVWES